MRACVCVLVLACTVCKNVFCAPHCVLIVYFRNKLVAIFVFLLRKTVNVLLTYVLSIVFEKAIKCCVNYPKRPVRHTVAGLYVQRSIKCENVFAK